MNEINATQLVIRKFLYAIRNYRKEDSEAGRWLDWLGDTLQYQDLMENMEPFGAEMLAEAKAFSLKKRLGGQLKAAKGSLIKEGNSNPTQKEIEERRMEMYGDETITAAAANREGVDESTTGCEATEEKAVEELPPDGSKKVNLPSTAFSSKKFPNGEFQNVMLTVDESAKLYMKLGHSADALIEELSQYLASSTKAKYKSHYATLLNWSRRKDAEAEPKKRYKTTEDISRENYEASKARLDAYFAAKERKEA